jgi:hypothetical protein
MHHSSGSALRSWLTIIAAVSLLAVIAAIGPKLMQPLTLSDAATEENDDVSSADTDAPPKHTNRLADETSPYLLQHAHNPVNWYPWGDEALDKAKAEDKPIFLSIGYSACHWCHVMERESFENEAIAAILNEHFISIKVDREERPDLDDIYMSAVQMMTGSGGWPMTVFMTPDRKPFYGGTYFPPEDRQGRPGFGTLLSAIQREWETNRSKINDSADELTSMIQKNFAMAADEAGAVTASVLDTGVQQLAQAFDPHYGGFGDAPKFPSSPSVALMLRQHARTGDANALAMAKLTLDKMYFGGMYDHLGGGFHRYSTDDVWLVPHFEKMLYDNGQLSKVYLDAYQATGNPRYKHVAEDIFRYQLRDMHSDSGAFYSTEDADSEGEEGKFYIWTKAEILGALGPEDGELFSTYYNVNPVGNFQSHEPYHANLNILHMTKPHEEIAEDLEMDADELEARMAPMREKLLAIRDKRIRPGLDDKILTSWNGLMISAFAKGYQVIGDERYKDAAEGAAQFVLDEMVVDGTLMRTHREGRSKLPAYLDDYAFMAVALIDLYEATFELKWLLHARELVEEMKTQFWDTEKGGFFYTGDNHRNLIARTKPTYDGAEPSGNSVAAEALLRLAKLVDEPEYYDMAEQMITMSKSNLERAPRGFLYMLGAVDFYLHPPKEIAIAGNADGAADLLSALHDEYIPNKVIALIDPDSPNNEALVEHVPLLAAKTLVDGKAAAYVCKDYACKRPVTTVDAFLEVLDVSEGDAT